MSQATIHRPPQIPARALPIGAEIMPGGGVHFRVWAPKRRAVQLVSEKGMIPVALSAEGNGYFSGSVAHAGAGTLYRFRLDEDEHPYPDPASRFQPQGPHGPSQVIDARTFRWTDQAWRGLAEVGQVLSETHIGTFSPQGTWAGAIEKLPLIKDAGITCIEVMPVAQFSGKFGWGYDGVNLFAPYNQYGTPDDFRAFMDAAHKIGLGVILDVVYNHFGPDGNYLPQFSDDYLAHKHANDWGEGINLDGENSGPVREFFISNARYWISEFHLDGFRFDATHVLVDDSPEHIMTAIRNAAVEAAGGEKGRQILTIGENEKQQSWMVRPRAAGGCGMTALWNDDWHHAAIVAATGRREAYYTDHLGKPQEFISAAKRGFLFQGQRYHWQEQRRGIPSLDLPPHAFVHFLENHDQIANNGRGMRLHQLTGAAELRVFTAMLLLGPQTPMLFMGQEFAASSQFHYFLDANEELAKAIYEGRKKDLAQFPSVATPQMENRIRDPARTDTFETAKLDWAERESPTRQEILKMHRDLIHLRREDPTLRRVQESGGIDGAVLSESAWVLRYFGEDGDDRLLLVNLGTDLDLTPAPEPLLAPPGDKRWVIAFSSEDPEYGGGGTPHPDTENEGWFLLGRSALLLRPASAAEATVQTRTARTGRFEKKGAS